METNLRPMSLGEILDRTAQLYRTNFVVFAGISAVYAGVLLVLSLTQIGVTQLLLSLHFTKQAPLVSGAFVLLILPLMVISAGAAVAANNRAVAWVNLGQPATIRSAYKSILPRLGRILWMMTIAFFIVYLPFLILCICYGVFLGVYGLSKGFFTPGATQSDPQAAILILIATFVFFLLALLAMVYLVLMALRYALAIPACIIEDLKATKALKRSVELSKGSRGRIFVLGLLIGVIQLGLGLLTQGPFMIAIIKMHGILPAWVQILQQLVGFFTNSFIGPMYATGLTLFYYDQRIRKEGFDIEWMMEAAGMTVPPPAEIPAPQLAAQAVPQPESEPVPQRVPQLEASAAPAAEPENDPETGHA
jgi:hypothetical protein